MKKILKKYGNSLVVTFSGEDQAILGIKEGDIITLTIEKSMAEEQNMPERDKAHE